MEQDTALHALQENPNSLGSICQKKVCVATGSGCLCPTPCGYVATIRIQCSDGFAGNITATQYKPPIWTGDQSSPSGFTSVNVTVYADTLLDAYQNGTPVTCPSGTKLAGVSAVAYAYGSGMLTNLQHLCRGLSGRVLLVVAWLHGSQTYSKQSELVPSQA
jgi:hypothetical protein